MTRYKVMTAGNSAVIVLPKAFRDENGIRAGDEVEVAFPTGSLMTVEPVRDESKTRKEDLEAFFSFVDGAEKTGREPLTPSEYRASMEARL